MLIKSQRSLMIEYSEILRKAQQLCTIFWSFHFERKYMMPANVAHVKNGN